MRLGTHGGRGPWSAPLCPRDENGCRAPPWLVQAGGQGHRFCSSQTGEVQQQRSLRDTPQATWMAVGCWGLPRSPHVSPFDSHGLGQPSAPAPTALGGNPTQAYLLGRLHRDELVVDLLGFGAQFGGRLGFLVLLTADPEVNVLLAVFRLQESSEGRQPTCDRRKGAGAIMLAGILDPASQAKLRAFGGSRGLGTPEPVFGILDPCPNPMLLAKGLESLARRRHVSETPVQPPAAGAGLRQRPRGRFCEKRQFSECSPPRPPLVGQGWLSRGFCMTLPL